MYDSLHRHRQKQDGEATQWRRISGGVLKRFQYLVSKLPLPMTEMITTMLRDIMIVWSTPVMMDGMASGLSTSFSGCPRDAQNATAASLMLAGTPRIPNAVRRMTGGIPKMTGLRMRGGLPVPKALLHESSEGLRLPFPA